MHPEPHTDLDNLNTVQHNLRNSAKGSNDAYNVPISLTVLKNKGEMVRARLVVREIKKARSEGEKREPSDVFSAMPPVESLKALDSHVMTERVDRRGRNFVLAVFDVSRAHSYGVCERDVYVEPRSESQRLGLGKLNKTMYGTQDASNAWQKLLGEIISSQTASLYFSMLAPFLLKKISFCFSFVLHSPRIEA